jgi:hypothetical protein
MSHLANNGRCTSLFRYVNRNREYESKKINEQIVNIMVTSYRAETLSFQPTFRGLVLVSRGCERHN